MTSAPLAPAGEAHRFDEGALLRYLQGLLPGFDGAVEIRKIGIGQSNPTYTLQTRQGRYVLRKRPAGNLLPSAHAVDREFQVMRALADSGVPVPKVHLLCTDESVIGEMFYVMEHVAGRTLLDPRLAEVERAQRAPMYAELAKVLARLHAVDFRQAGLQGFGRPENYVARQVERWSKQYEASRVEANEHMERLMSWLREHVPARDEAAIVHGDYQTHNVLFHPTGTDITAVVDWELSTIGHPMADLAYCCLPYYAAPDDARGFRGETPASLGLPSVEEFVAAYCRESGRDAPGDWLFFIIFSLFRQAAIRAGVYKRALQGSASSDLGLEVGARYRMSAQRGWELARALTGGKDGISP
ncbi:MAG TPA: phosphotransferase [Burkholderiales bacterium]|nr:phosphotransferase [Burkholderiales bacterium]